MANPDAPQIELRVTGPWTSPENLADAIAPRRLGYHIEAEALVHDASGARFELGATPHDDEIAELFAHNKRLSRREVEAVAGHAVKVHLAGPGGSVRAARAMMDAATALVRAGGTGVMIDSSTATHGRRDWLKLADDPDDGGLYWAYVVLAGDADEVWSTGMHCLGFRDAVLPDAPDPQFAWFMLNNFLGYTYQSGVMVMDGDPVGDEQGALFRARAEPCTRYAAGTPCHNPYGVWRLERFEDHLHN